MKRVDYCSFYLIETLLYIRIYTSIMVDEHVRDHPILTEYYTYFGFFHGQFKILTNFFLKKKKRLFVCFINIIFRIFVLVPNNTYV